jgi:hypothetical protein
VEKLLTVTDKSALRPWDQRRAVLGGSGE